MNCFVYIIQSQKNSTYYVGSSINPEKRLMSHNLGKTLYTKRNRPYRLVFAQEFDSVSKARLIEKKVKSWKRRDFIEKIINDGSIRST